MSGMDRLTDEYLKDRAQFDTSVGAMAREILAHRRASQAAPAPVAWRGKHFHPEASAWIYKDGPEKPATAFGSIGQLEPLYAAPAPSDGLREAALSSALSALAETSKHEIDRLTSGLRGVSSSVSPRHFARLVLLGYMPSDIKDMSVAQQVAALSASPAQEGGE